MELTNLKGKRKIENQSSSTISLSIQLSPCTAALCISGTCLTVSHASGLQRVKYQQCQVADITPSINSSLHVIVSIYSTNTDEDHHHFPPRHWYCLTSPKPRYSSTALHLSLIFSLTQWPLRQVSSHRCYPHIVSPSDLDSRVRHWMLSLQYKPRFLPPLYIRIMN